MIRKAPGRIEPEGWTYTDMIRRRDLQVITQSVEDNISELQRDPERNRDKIDREKAILEAVRNELEEIERNLSFRAGRSPDYVL
jgi:hypothetical protein